MRYRAFGLSQPAASALSLALTDEPMRKAERTRLILAALESGINTFEIRATNPKVATDLAEALSAVERHMLLIMFRLGWKRDARGERVRDLSPEAIRPAIETFLKSTGFGYLDVVIIDALEDEALPPYVIPDLHRARDEGRVRMVGVCGGASADAHLAKSDFDVLSTSFNLESGWGERHRVRGAASRDMPVIGCDFFPAALGGVAIDAEPEQGLAGLFLMPKRAVRLPSAFAFMTRTPGWTAEQICLAYSLTEPSISTIQTATTDVDELALLTSAVERDLPGWLPAQIEMARFSADEQARTLAKRGPEA